MTEFGEVYWRIVRVRSAVKGNVVSSLALVVAVNRSIVVLVKGCKKGYRVAQCCDESGAPPKVQWRPGAGDALCAGTRTVKELNQGLCNPVPTVGRAETTSRVSDTVST